MIQQLTQPPTIAASSAVIVPVEASAVGHREDTPAEPLWQPQGDDRWHVLHCRSRQEKALAQTLGQMGIRHFLPLLTQTRKYGRRKLTVDLPLFPGYVFLFGRRDEAFLADRTRRLAGIIPVPDQATLLHELTQIHRALAHQAPLDPYPYLRRGIRAVVRSGPMQGLEGVIEDRRRTDRLILKVETLGQAVALEIDGALLEPLA